jgi:hypothetical protein
VDVMHSVDKQNTELDSVIISLLVLAQLASLVLVYGTLYSRAVTHASYGSTHGRYLYW